jgi:hypothetical protein
MTRKIAVTILLLVIPGLLSGCLAVAAAGGATAGVLYVKGAYQKTYPVAVEQAYNASLAMLDADKTPVYSKEVGNTIGAIEATLSDGKKLKMSFKATGASTTEVTIRIGTFGDKDRSNYFFSQLDKRLSTR